MTTPAETAERDGADTKLVDARPAERLISLLRIVNRSILPRHVSLANAQSSIVLDLATGRLQLGVQSGSHFVIDEALAQAAPNAHRLLRWRARAVTRHDETLRDHQPALCACAARALLRFSAEGALRHTIEAAPVEEVWAAASFSAMELYDAARQQADGASRGPVRAFFDTVLAKMDEAWLLSQDGWVVQAPAQARNLEHYAEMTKTARLLGAWVEPSADRDAPRLAYAARPPREHIWCIASDAHHIALLQCPPLQWAASLNAWRGHTTIGN